MTLRCAIFRSAPNLLRFGLASITPLALFTLVSTGATAYGIGGEGDGQTPAGETQCDGLAGAAFGLCSAYCEAQDCDTREPERESCKHLRRSFASHTGTYHFPCDPLCGNGRVDEGESCDPPNEFCRGGCNPLYAVCVDMACSDQCSCPAPYCGDFVVDPGEECDDGNNVDGDLCSSDCVLEGAPCAGFGDIQCLQGEFCEFAQGTCGTPQPYVDGVCTPISDDCFSRCNTPIDPVCGCDGNTYPTDCVRRCSGASLDHRGDCAADQ